MKPPFSKTPPDPEQGGEGGLPSIGGFRLIRRLATGGTADIFLARAAGPHGFERVVVLKVLHGRFRSEPAFERMFAREASAYARLSHPAIVKLFDFFSSNGQLVMVLEHVDGLPLNKLRAMLGISGDKLDDRAALFVASRVFAALAAAHAAKDPESGEFAPVIHRDVNPSNVLVPWDGHVKLADFGIAKVTGMQGDTKTGYIKGTYGYMAPEQVRGETVTGRADVYAATLLLWELLTRRKAIQRGALPEVEVLKAMAKPQFPPLDALRPDVEPAVRDAVRRGLEPVADRRSVTAEEMHAVLRTAIQGGDEARSRLVEALSRVRPSPAADLAVTTARLLPDALRTAGASEQDSAQTGVGQAEAALPRPEKGRSEGTDRTPRPALAVPRPQSLRPPRPSHNKERVAPSTVPAEPSTVRQAELATGDAPTLIGATPNFDALASPLQLPPITTSTPTKPTVPSPGPSSMTHPFPAGPQPLPGAGLGFAKAGVTPQSTTSPYGDPPRPAAKLAAPPTLAFGSTLVMANAPPVPGGPPGADNSSVRALPGNTLAHEPAGAPGVPSAAAATTPVMHAWSPAPFSGQNVAADASSTPEKGQLPAPHPADEPGFETLVAPPGRAAPAAMAAIPSIPPLASMTASGPVGTPSPAGGTLLSPVQSPSFPPFQDATRLSGAGAGAPQPLPYQRPAKGRGAWVVLVLFVALAGGVAAGYFGFYWRPRAGVAAPRSGEVASVPTAFLSTAGAATLSVGAQVAAAPDEGGAEGMAPSARRPPSGVPAAALAPVPAVASATTPVSTLSAASAAAARAGHPSALPGASASAPIPVGETPPAAPAAPPEQTTQPAAQGAAAAPATDSGDLVVGGPGGHRVFVDGKVVGQSPGTFRVRCGDRSVHVGSAQAPKTVRVPCGGAVPF